MIVYKFGGTSLADAGRYRHAAQLVARTGAQPVIVVSAAAGVTDELFVLVGEAWAGLKAQARRRAAELRERHEAIARELFGERSLGDEPMLQRMAERFAELEALIEAGASVEDDEREAAAPAGLLVDAVCALGEDLSAELMAAALDIEGMQSEVVDARRVVRTDARFGGAVPLDERTASLVREVIGPSLKRGRVPVLQGFVGATEEGVTTTLGRGGSDFTAAVVGAALGAEDVSIWTDVDGVMSADPAQVSEARTLKELGYEEAVEMAYFGARAIHPAAAKHAAARDISLRIRNTFSPDSAGTLIRHDRRRASGVAAVAYKPEVTLIKVRSRPMFMAYGFLARVFEVLARHRLPVDLVATSHTSTAFTIDQDHSLDAVRRELGSFAEVEVISDLATVSVIGHGLLQQLGITARVFATLEEARVELISQASDVCLSFLVGTGEAPDVVRRLHRDLIEREDPGP